MKCALCVGKGRGIFSWRCPVPCCHKLMQVSAPRTAASIDDVGGGSVVLPCPQGEPPAAAAHIDNRFILL